jgi:KAP family P-loop domain
MPLPLGNFKFDKVVENFDSPSNVFIPTITKEIETMIQDGKLIIFIDDLDRCKIENILGILEAVKIFLQSKGVVIVIGVEMGMLERAWRVRYGEDHAGNHRGTDFLDKIFQLRLSLPEKDEYEMKKYINSIAAFLQPEEFNLLYSGFPHNPRKIKKVLNLVYFLSTNLNLARLLVSSMCIC